MKKIIMYLDEFVINEKQKPIKEHYGYICGNCKWYNAGKCYNCDDPRNAKTVSNNGVCDGGGSNADDYGFAPNGSKIRARRIMENNLYKNMNILNTELRKAMDFIKDRGLLQDFIESRRKK